MIRYPARLTWPHRIFLAMLLCFTTAAAFAQSDAYRRGAQAYDNKDYRQAHQYFQQAVKENPQDAKAYWGLGTTFARQNDFRGTVRAWDRAMEIDPQLSFTSRPDMFRQKYKEAVQRAGRQESATGGSRQNGARKGMDPSVARMMKELETSDAFVASSVSHLATDQRMEAIADRYQPRTVKIAVLGGTPTGRDRNPSNDLHEFTHSLYNHLRIRDGLVVVVAPRGVSAYTDDLNRSDLHRIIQDSSITFAKSYDAGVQQIADQTFQQIQANQRSSQGTLLFLLIAAVGGVTLFTNRRKAARRKRITELNRALTTRLAELQDEFKRFDLEVAQQTQTTPLLEEAKQLRSAAVDPFAEAGEQFNLARTVEQYEEVDRLTIQAEKLAARARIRLDQALGRRSLDNPEEDGSIPSADSVPEAERGACFFCSKPARMGDLEPLEIRLEEGTRRVLACDDCTEVARTGRKPQILTVPDDQDENRRVPWYQSQRYDPWNDYGRGGGYMGGGIFGGGGFGLMDYLLLDSLFDSARRENTTVISPNDPGYGSNPAGGDFFGEQTGDSVGGFFGGSVEHENENSNAGPSGLGDFFGGSVEGDGGNDFFSSGDLFDGDSGGDFFGSDGGGDFFGSDN